MGQCFMKPPKQDSLEDENLKRISNPKPEIQRSQEGVNFENLKESQLKEIPTKREKSSIFPLNLASRFFTSMKISLSNSNSNPTPHLNSSSNPSERPNSNPNPNPHPNPNPDPNPNPNSRPKFTALRYLKKLTPPARKMKGFLVRRQGSVQHNEASVEKKRGELGLDKSFGFLRNFHSSYEIGEEVGRGNFGRTCVATSKVGVLKGEEFAVKVISKEKMTRSVEVEDVKREVKILSGLSGYKNLVQLYAAYEDDDSVYIVMELCKGGELLDQIIERGGKYSEEDAKKILVQILSIVSYLHLHGVVHRDLKPENFMLASKGDDSSLKAIDFGLSSFVKPEERLKDIVGSPCYVSPEVLLGCSGTEADMWSVGVISYVLLSGSVPFWAPTQSAIFRAVLKARPNFENGPWRGVSPLAKDFVKGLLNKDYRKRMTASQALCHPWLRDSHEVKIPSDIIIYRQIRAYFCSSSLRKSALKALAKTLTPSQLSYFREQFELMGPNKNGYISLQNLKMALAKSSTEAVRDSRVLEFVNLVSFIQDRELDFKEFTASAISVYQMKGFDTWHQHVRLAYEIFDREGNRRIKIKELASELGLRPSAVLKDWIRDSDRKLSILGFVKLLQGGFS